MPSQTILVRLVSYETPLEDYELIPLPTDLPSQPKQIKTKQAKTGKVKRTKAGVVKDFVPVENRSYSGRQLMKRFKCGDRLLRIRRSQPDFADWSKQRDPEGVVWKYQDDNFFPQLG